MYEFKSELHTNYTSFLLQKSGAENFPCPDEKNTNTSKQSTKSFETKVRTPIWLHDHSDDLDFLYTLYAREIDSLNPDVIQYLPADEKAVLIENIRMALWINVQKSALDKIKHRRYRLNEYIATQEQAKALLDALEGIARSGEANSEEKPKIPAAHPAIRYLGLNASVLLWAIIDKLEEYGRENKEKLKALLDSWKSGKTKLLFSWLGEINGLRLYWIWGGSLLDTVLTLANQFGQIDDRFFTHLEKLLHTPGPITGNLSWILYYAGFSLAAFLFLKNVIPNPFMSQENKNLHCLKRFEEEWKLRKGQLINYGVWGTANLACYFWLTARQGPRLGMAGDYVTALLLLMDAVLALLKFAEEKKKHDSQMQKLRADLNQMKREWNAECAKPESESDKDKLAMLRKHMQAQQKRIERLEFDWFYRKWGLYADLFYACSLLLAFSLMVGLFIPGGQAAPLALIVVGVVGCFVVSVIYNTLHNLALPVLKTRGEIGLLRAELINLEVKCLGETGAEKSALELRIKDIEQQISYHQKHLIFQIACGIRGLMIDSLTPAVVLVSLMFMPIGIGVGSISAYFALAVGSKLLLNRFKPCAVKPTKSDFFAPEKSLDGKDPKLKNENPEDQNSENKEQPGIS